MHTTEQVGQTVLVFGYDDKMHMIWHEAVSPNGNAGIALVLRKKINIHVVVADGKECLLASISALCHMMWVVRNYYSGDPCHCYVL